MQDLLRFPVNGRYDGSEIMDTFEIHDDEIDVEEIMKKIKDNIRMRKEAGVYPQDGIEMGPAGNSPECSTNVQRDLEYINANWDIQNNSYFISSHRPVVGKPLVKGRELVHGEVRRYVDPIIWKQTEFNGSTARYLNNVNEKINAFENVIGNEIEQLRPEIDDKIEQLRPEIDDKIEQLRPEIDGKIEQLRPEIDDKIEQLRPEIDGKIEQLRPEIDGKIDQLRPEIDDKIDQLRSEINDLIESQVSSVISSMNSDIENKAWLANILEKRNSDNKPINFDDEISKESSINYFTFSEEVSKAWTKEGGKPIDVPNMYEDLLPFFNNCNNVLEIGSGTGYFLQLLKNNGVGSYGIDINEDYVLYCEKLGLSIQNIDALSHLMTIDDKSIDGIFMGQVVEHLNINELFQILKLCYEKLQFGSYIAMSMPNILSVLVSTNLFNMDPTHETYIHPEVIKFLLKSCGFREIQENFYQPVPDESKLKRIDPSNIPNEQINNEILETLNFNINFLNNFLFGYRDYLVIGKK
ncbi:MULTISPECIES: methionine biosynthesis protein MetW [Methanohalophilus]|nr:MULTISPECIES: methionine biosynthesis protein MetW [Methanohalophilus]